MDRLVRPNRLANEVFLADGIGSSGKRMLSHILASLERVEKQSHHMAFDYVAQYNWLGRIDDEAAANYLQIEADYQLYHIMMSRDVNFRPKDATGVLQNPKKLAYFCRLFSKEGDPVLRRILKENPILNEVPHDGLRNGSLYFKAFGDKLKIVHILRHPYDITMDWIRRGFDTRIGKDKREFQITIEDGKGFPVPFFLKGVPIDFDSLSLFDRAAFLTSVCSIQNFQGYQALDAKQKSSVHFMAFDSLCSSPDDEVAELVNFLGTPRTKHTKLVLRKEGLPRNLVTAERVSFLDRISSPDVRKAASHALEIYNSLSEYVHQSRSSSRR